MCPPPLGRWQNLGAPLQRMAESGCPLQKPPPLHQQYFLNGPLCIIGLKSPTLVERESEILQTKMETILLSTTPLGI